MAARVAVPSFYYSSIELRTRSVPAGVVAMDRMRNGMSDTQPLSCLYRSMKSHELELQKGDRNEGWTVRANV
jgi:hypothetical protein